MAALTGAEMAKLSGRGQRIEDAHTRAVMAAWNLMNGIEWGALEVVAEMVGANDIELLIDGLVMIRDR